MQSFAGVNDVLKLMDNVCSVLGRLYSPVLLTSPSNAIGTWQTAFPELLLNGHLSAGHCS